MVEHFKGACSDPKPHPPTFFKHGDWPEVELYLEGFMCEVCKICVATGVISENPSWKLENMVTIIYKTINIVFSICKLLTLDDIVVGKLTKSASFKENLLSSNFGTGTLNFHFVVQHWLCYF